MLFLNSVSVFMQMAINNIRKKTIWHFKAQHKLISNVTSSDLVVKVKHIH